MNKSLMEARTAVHAALADDFDTPEAMRELKKLVHSVNKYVKSVKVAVPLLIKSIGDYVTNMFTVFGLINPLPDIGYPVNAAGGAVRGLRTTTLLCG